MKTRGIIINLSLIVVLVLLLTVGVIRPKANANGSIEFDNRAKIVQIKPDGSTDVIVLNEYFELVNAKVAKVKINDVEQKDPYFVIGKVYRDLDKIKVTFKTALGLKEYKIQIDLANFIEFKVGEEVIDIKCRDHVIKNMMPAGYDWFLDKELTRPYDVKNIKEIRILYGKAAA